MYPNIMLDLETLGTVPGSAIIAIAAARFGNGQIVDTLSVKVAAASCVALGLTIDGNTVDWWMQQPDRVREAAFGGDAIVLEYALHDLTAFVERVPETKVWGDGATFDNVLITEAYRAAGLNRPWGYRADRCYRTVKNLHPEVEYVQEGDEHIALFDAISQAKHLMKIRPEL